MGRDYNEAAAARRRAQDWACGVTFRLSRACLVARAARFVPCLAEAMLGPENRAEATGRDRSHTVGTKFVTCREAARVSHNVPAVHEAPELTARSARRFHRQQHTCTFQGLRWQGRASGRRMNPMLSDRAPLKQRDLVAWRYQKDRLPARGAAAQSGGIGAERQHLARASRLRTPARSSRRRAAAAAVTTIPFAHV